MAENMCFLKPGVLNGPYFSTKANRYNAVGPDQALSFSESFTASSKGTVTIHMYASNTNGTTSSSTVRSVTKNGTAIGKTGGDAYNAVLSEYWTFHVQKNDVIVASLNVSDTSASNRAATLFIQFYYNS